LVENPKGVASSTLLKKSLPIIDSQLPIVIGRWRYQPYPKGGKPTPSCYATRYRMK
jgi:hypothetical protein